MPDLYCVFGNPIAHSKSPAIHAAFAASTGEKLIYEARLAPIDGFTQAIAEFVAAGGRGANVTVPFKEEAFRLCDQLAPRAARAGAVNTLSFVEGKIHGDNTDGAGLVADITDNLGFSPAGKRILLLGAGGAARGVIEPLLATRPAALHIANRTADKAATLAAAFADIAAPQGDFLRSAVNASNFTDLAGSRFDLVINATSASLAGDALPLPAGIFAPGCLAYDMMYGKGETPFLRQARTQGADRCADGLGMLVCQAAEAFAIWRGVRPATGSVLNSLRAALAE
jgi:shikimate dehydrogenase